MLQLKTIFLFLFSLVLLSACSGFNFKKQKGEYYQMKKGESIQQVADRYKVDANMIRQENLIIEDEDLAVGSIIFIPNLNPSKGTRSFPDQYAGKVRLRGGLIWPSEGRISSKFGKRHGRPHQGIDLTSSKGLKIVSVARGVVEFSGRQRGYGKTLIIDHGSGIKTLYAHNKRILVRKGQRIRKGQKVAIMGNTGRSTGVHLHFEVRVKGVARNPLRYLPSR